MENSNLIIGLLVLQSLLLIGVLFALSQMISRVGAAGERVDALAAGLDKMVREELKPALGEARDAIRKLDGLAEGTAKTLSAAEPLVSAVSEIATIFKRPSTPVWMDAIRLAVSVFGMIRSKDSEEDDSAPALPESTNKD